MISYEFVYFTNTHSSRNSGAVGVLVYLLLTNNPIYTFFYVFARNLPITIVL
jgi:hypothetical protein